MLTRGDNHVIAFARAISRSEQILTEALLTECEEDYLQYLRDASAISQEWGFTEDLRLAICEAAAEHVGVFS